MGTTVSVPDQGQAILAGATATNIQETPEAWINQRAEFLSRHVDRNVTPAQQRMPDAAELRPGAGAAGANGQPDRLARRPSQLDALEYIARGQSALARGRTGAARVYLQMAARRADGPLRDRLLAALHGISPAKPNNR